MKEIIISDIDPYGEENWNDEPIENEIHYGNVMLKKIITFDLVADPGFSKAKLKLIKNKLI